MATHRPIHVFLGRCRRRWIALRAVEGGGVGLLVGAGAGLIVMALTWWRGGDGGATTIASASLLLGFAAGVVASLGRRPSLGQTASAVDRQFLLQDLLSTALAFQKSDDPAFAALVRHQAEKQVATLSPSDLVLRRLGVRGWGGIGLSAALVMTLGLLLSTAPDTQAMPETASVARQLGATEPSRHFTRLTLPETTRRDVGTAPPAGLPQVAVPHPDALAGDDAAHTPGIRSLPDSTESTGGLATTEADVQAPRFTPEGILRPRAGSKPSDGQGLAGAPGRTEGAGTASGFSGGTTSGLAWPPWRSEGWTESQERVLQALGEGTVPAEYRDVVRVYFDRSDQ